jgi:hypothetical protein
MNKGNIVKKCFIVALVAFVFSTVVYAGEYWPSEVGSVYTYVNDDGEVLEVTYSTFGRRISRYIGQSFLGAYRVTDYMTEDAEGDVYLTSTEGYAEGAIDPDYFRSLGSEFKFIDLPLVPGNSWTSFAATPCCYGPCDVILFFTVLGEAEVVVPAGTFTVVELSVTNLPLGCIQYPETGTFALDRDLGPVILPGGFKLVGVEGVVAVDETTWGGLKALYS